MNLGKKVLHIVAEEGLGGLSLRLNRYFWNVYLYLANNLKFSKVYSAYSIWLTPNFSDETFNYYVRGSYGYQYSRHLLSIEDRFHFIDIGANQGLYTIIAAKNKNISRVIAFEPVPSTYELMKKNIRLNQVESIVTPIRRAVSSGNVSQRIYLSENHSGAATLSMNNSLSQISSSWIDIEIINKHGLDELDIRDNLPIFIKVDVEGHEIEALQEVFASNLEPQICEIFLEVYDEWVSGDDIRAFMREYGFNYFQKIGESDRYFDLLCRREP